MTTTEIQLLNPAESLPVLVEMNEIYPSFEVKGIKDTYSVQFVDHTHVDVVKAKEIERLTFTELGDNPNEVDQEFVQYDKSSIFVLLRSAGDQAKTSAGDNAEKPLLGMARFIPYHDQGNKTFNDLASLLVSSDQEGLQEGKIAVESGSEKEQATDDVIKHFMKQYGCDDIDKVIDIATLAPDMELDFKSKLDVIESLLKAMDVFVLDLYKKGQLTHLTQFTAEAMHGILVNRYGYPMHNLFGLPPLIYDTFGNEKGDIDNMVAVPSVIKLEELEQVFNESYSGNATKHMASVITQLAVSFSCYSVDAA